MKNVAKKLVDIFEEEQEREYWVMGQKLGFVQEVDGVPYFAYVLQDRMIVTKDKKRADVLELVFFELKEELPKVIEPYELIKNAVRKYKVGKIANRMYESTEVWDMKEIEDRIPQPKIEIEEGRWV